MTGTKLADSGTGKLVELLEALASRELHAGRNGMTVTGLARELGRDKSAVSRQLKPMVELGLVERHPDGLHSLGWRLFAISARAGDQRLLLAAEPLLRRLRQRVRERVHFSVLQGAHVLTLASESSRRSIEATDWVGRTSPVTCTSSGRSLLLDHTAEDIAELLGRDFYVGEGVRAPQTLDDLVARVAADREVGVCYVESEFDDDLAGIAAPVRGARNEIVGTINVSGPVIRISPERAQITRAVRSAARHLSAQLGSPPPDNT